MSTCNPSVVFCFFFFFNDTATTEIYTLSLHDALPISNTDVRHPRIDESHGTQLQHSRRHARAGLHIPDILFARRNLLWLHGAFHLAVPRRDRGKKPALLFSLAHSARVAGSREVSGRVDCNLSDLWRFCATLLHLGLWALWRTRQGICVQWSWPWTARLLSACDRAGVPGLWVNLSRPEPALQEPNHSRRGSAVVGIVPCCSAVSAAEVQRHVLPEAAFPGHYPARWSHGSLHRDGGPGFALAGNSRLADTERSDSGFRRTPHPPDRDQLFGRLGITSQLINIDGHRI